MTANATVQAELLAPGVRVGRYEILRRLAVGGMAEIHLARATGIEGFEKLVVLKRILPQFAVKPEFVAMFLDEARLSATLEHPNIAQVYDIGEVGGSYFFTMEYIRGEDVRAILARAVMRRAQVPLEHALTIIIAAAAGLHAAHERCGPDGEPLQIVHRDVSPSNVLVSYDGAVKLVDFGVAKAAQRQTETRTGTLKGKAAYMSPEQCTAGEIDRRSDVFGLGILLYELTTCRRLFMGDTEFAIMSKIVHEDVEPPSRLVSSYPPELEDILLRALQRDPAARYPTAQQLQVELEEFARRHRLSVSPVGLASYMREVFGDRVHASSVRAAAAAPAGEEGEALADGDSLGVDIEIEEGSAIAPPPRRLRWAVAAAVAAAGLTVPFIARDWSDRDAVTPAASAVEVEPRANERAEATFEPSSSASAPAAIGRAPASPELASSARPHQTSQRSSEGGTNDDPASTADASAADRAEPDARTRQSTRPSRKRRAPAAEPRERPSWDLDSPLPPPEKE